MYSTKILYLLGRSIEKDCLKRLRFFENALDFQAEFISSNQELSESIYSGYFPMYYVELGLESCNFVRFEKVGGDKLSKVESFRCKYPHRVDAIRWIRNDTKTFSDMVKWCDNRAFEGAEVSNHVFSTPDVQHGLICSLFGLDADDKEGISELISYHENVPYFQIDSYAQEICKGNLLCCGKYIKVYKGEDGFPKAEMISVYDNKIFPLKLEHLRDVCIETFNKKLTLEECIQEIESGIIPITYDEYSSDDD